MVLEITLVGVYISMVVIGSIIAAMIAAFENENEANILTFAVSPQMDIYRSLKNEINTVGICICLIVVSIFLWPCNILLFIIRAVMRTCTFSWALFKKIFKKKEKELNDQT